jgi:hypothetical protein
MRPASPSYSLPPLAIPNAHSGSETARFFSFDDSESLAESLQNSLSDASKENCDFSLFLLNQNGDVI